MPFVFPVYHSTPQSSPCSCKSSNLCPSMCKSIQYSTQSVKRPQLQQKDTYYAKYVHGSPSYCMYVVSLGLAQVQADPISGRASHPGSWRITRITPTNHTTACPCHTRSHPSQHLTPIILVNNTQAFINTSKSSSLNLTFPQL